MRSTCMPPRQFGPCGSLAMTPVDTPSHRSNIRQPEPNKTRAASRNQARCWFEMKPDAHVIVYQRGQIPRLQEVRLSGRTSRFQQARQDPPRRPHNNPQAHPRQHRTWDISTLWDRVSFDSVPRVRRFQRAARVSLEHPEQHRFGLSDFKPESTANYNPPEQRHQKGHEQSEGPKVFGTSCLRA